MAQASQQSRQNIQPTRKARLGWQETKIHLFFNTGMNREGVQEDELSGVIKELQSHPNLMVE